MRWSMGGWEARRFPLKKPSETPESVRIGEVEMRNGGIGRGNGRARPSDLGKGAHQAFGVTREQRRIGVGQEFPAARDGRTHDGRQQRRNQEHVNVYRYQKQGIANLEAAVEGIKTGPPPAEPVLAPHQVGHTQKQGEGCRHHIQTRIVVADVRQFVGQNAFQFAAIQQREQSVSDRDDGGLRGHAGGEGVQRHGFDHIEPGCGQSGADGQVFQNALGFAFFVAGGTRIAHHQELAGGRGCESPDQEPQHRG